MIVRSAFSDHHQRNDSLFAYLCQADLTVCTASSLERNFNPDSEVGGIVLVFVVELVLDLWDFGAEKRARSFGNYFAPSL